MFYTENLPNTTKSVIRVKLSDFSKGINTKLSESLLPLNYAVNTYNFDFNSGTLKQGLGIKELEVPYYNTTKIFVAPEGVNQILRCWTYTRYEKTTNDYVPLLIIYCDNQKMYYARIEGNAVNFVDLDVVFDSIPHGFTYRIDEGDCFFAVSKNKIMKFNGTSVPTIYTENIPPITSIALHAGRLFATVSGDENRLMFSDDLNPTNWNISAFEGGYIELADERGRLKKVIESCNYLYVIREYGISRVSAWGLQSNFSVKNMYLTKSKIYANSAVLCGKTIMMLCKDGIYYFNGTEIQKLNFGIDKYLQDVDNENAIGAFLDGKYYLACRLNFDDGRKIGCESTTYTNNALIEVDVGSGEINIVRGIDIVYINPLQTAGISKLMIGVKGGYGKYLGELSHEGRFFSTISHKIWQSPFTDAGYPNYRKVIKNLIITTKTDIKAIFCVDGKNYTFNIKANTKPKRVPINLVGHRFSVTFECVKSLCEISNPQLEINLI